MKKLKRLAAVILTGVMLLSMTACSGFGSTPLPTANEDIMSRAILSEINAHCKENDLYLVPMDPELMTLAKLCMQTFERAGKTELSSSELSEYLTVLEGGSRYVSHSGGVSSVTKADKETYYKLVTEYTTWEDLRVQLKPLLEAIDKEAEDRLSWNYNGKITYEVGFAFATVEGKTYWMYEFRLY